MLGLEMAGLTAPEDRSAMARARNVGVRSIANRARCLATCVLALTACGAPGGPSIAASVTSGAQRHERAEAHLFGITEQAFPELAPLWPALSARAATEVSEQLRVGEGGVVHCVELVVEGDLAREARAAWREGAAAAGYACELIAQDGSEVRCEHERTRLRVLAEDAPTDDDASLEALASEMGVEPEPSSVAVACVDALPAARLARLDERLHRAGLLEPWHDLHEQLGARRLSEITWTRSERGDEVSVTYRADEEAIELAGLWARENGLVGVEGFWQRVGGPLRIALGVRAPPPMIELTLERDAE